MKKASVSMVVAVLCFSALLPIVQVRGWGKLGLPPFIHGEMALDALEGLGFTQNADETEEIAHYAWYADVDPETTPGYLIVPAAACHRVEKYQREFEEHGGGIDTLPAADILAAQYVEQARVSFDSGDRAAGQRRLGFAVHFIQDAVCPAHVFPFRCGSEPDTHNAFESWTNDAYSSKNWPSLVGNAPIESVTGPEEVLSKIRAAADWVATLACSYVRQDGVTVVDSRVGGVSSDGWRMTDGDIGRCMKKAASLVKGATLWVMNAPVPRVTSGSSYINVAADSLFSVDFVVRNFGGPSSSDSYLTVSVSNGLEMVLFSATPDPSDLQFTHYHVGDLISYSDGSQRMAFEELVDVHGHPYSAGELVTVTILFRAPAWTAAYLIKYRAAMLPQGVNYPTGVPTLRDPDTLTTLDQQGYPVYTITVEATARTGPWFAEVTHEAFDSDGDGYNDAVKIGMDADTPSGTATVHAYNCMDENFGSGGFVDQDSVQWTITGTRVEWTYSFLYVDARLGIPAGNFKVTLHLYDASNNLVDSYIFYVDLYPGQARPRKWFQEVRLGYLMYTGSGVLVPDGLYSNVLTVSMNVDTEDGTDSVDVYGYLQDEQGNVVSPPGRHVGRIPPEGEGDPTGAWDIGPQSEVEWGLLYLYLDPPNLPGSYTVFLELYDYHMPWHLFDTWTGTTGPLFPTDYDPAQYATVTVNPNGGRIYVDGSPITETKTYDWIVESSHTLDPDSGYFSSPGTKLVFTQWDDGSTADPRSIDVPEDDAAYMVQWKSQYMLTVNSVHGNSNPPASPSGYYYDEYSWVTCSVTSPVTEDGTAWCCTGWTGTGSVPLNGEDTSVGFTLSEDSSITWNWQTCTLDHLVVRGLDNGIYCRIHCSPVGSWEDWNRLPGETCDSPAAIVYQNQLHIVVRGMDGNSLWHGYLSNPTDLSSFSGWTLLSGATPSAPTLTSNGTVLCLVVRGLDNRIYYRYYSSGSWGTWYNVPTGATLDNPGAAMLGGNLHVVVRGMDGSSLWHVIVSDGVVVRNWIGLSGSTLSRPVLAADPGSNKLYLAVRGSDDGIYHREYVASTDSWALNWIRIPTGATCDGPGATMIGSVLHIVVRGMDGDTLWHWDGTDWHLISGSTHSPPTLTS